MIFRKISNHSKQIIKWLWSGKFHLCSLLSVIVMFSYLAGWLTFCPNLIAFLFTILGLIIIFIIQFLVAREFSYHRPNTIRKWLHSFPTGKPIILPIKPARSGGRTYGPRVRTLIPDGLSDEEKIARLIKKVDSLETALGNADDLITEVNTAMDKQINDLRAGLNNYNSSLREIVAGHAVGDYDLNLFGIVITFCGTIIQFFKN